MVRYTTREAVKAGPGFSGSAVSNSRIDDAIESASRAIESGLHRRFYPEIRTVSLDWPNHGSRKPWRLWLDNNEVISVDTLVAGGVTISSSDYMLRRSDDLNEPPYDRIEVDRSSSAVFQQGDTSQKAIVITGTFGYTENTKAAGALDEALDDSETGVDVTNGALVGVGDLLKVDDEWMNVTDRTMLDTGQNIGANLASDKSVVTVAVTTGSEYFEGETILVDAEKMLITEVAGNNLIVKRAVDGSPLAAHTSGADVYSPRTLVVERGVLGTTAASHTTATAVARLDVPGPVRKLANAIAVDTLLQESSGYSRTVGSGENEREAYGRALKTAWEEAIVALGNQERGY